MAENRGPPAPNVTAEEQIGDDITAVSESELARRKLRQRWELASVLNFLNVFEPVIQSKLKISAEEIEMALIKPNNLLAQLHTMLLKGIPPVSKTLNGCDAWVTALSKKLTMWWPWVAEGDFPLTAAKGEEISRYKELDPTIRLMILKALCEIRADQGDVVSYINDALKNGSEISNFQKDKIGRDGSGTAYWYDGNAIIGHRLYKEVNKFESKPNVKGKGTIPTINSQWETLATNLEEFRKVVDEFASSEGKLEVAVSKTLETVAIPVLVKLQKKKERALKQHQRQEILLNGFRNSGITRSCRNRGPVRYTFDEYDKAIDEAIQQIKKKKPTEELGNEHIKRNETASNGGLDRDTKSGDSESTESDTQSDRLQGGDVEDSDDEYDGKKEDNGSEDGSDSGSFNNDNGNEDGSDSSSFNKENNNLGNRNHTTLHSQKRIATLADRPKSSHWSKRVAGIAGHTVPEVRNIGAKNRLRQRPTRNTALESAVAPDSEDGNSSEDTSYRNRGCENLSPASYTDDDSDS